MCQSPNIELEVKDNDETGGKESKVVEDPPTLEFLHYILFWYSFCECL